MPIRRRGSEPWSPTKEETESDAGSTSDGSGLRAEDFGDDWDFVSPVSWRVRNTFLDNPLGKPTLLQSFHRARRSSSTPAGGREANEREEAPALLAMTPVRGAAHADFAMTPGFASTPFVESPESQLCSPVLPTGQQGLYAPPSAPPPCAPPAYASPQRPPPPDAPPAAGVSPVLSGVHGSAVTAAGAPQPLSLADLVAPRTSCSTGSALHFQGKCKPCAFFWKVVGCKYGSECQFCHLCDPDERKRRNREKRMAMHAVQAARAQCSGLPPPLPRGTNRLSLNTASI